MDLGKEMVFLTPYTQKKLIADAQMAQAFSVDDSQYYLGLLDLLSDSPGAREVQIAFNATAAKAFYRPLMPKSWFYLPATRAMCDSQQSPALVKLTGICGAQGHYVLLDNHGAASTVMLLDEQHELDATKSLSRFDVIKVMNDRIAHYRQESELRYSA